MLRAIYNHYFRIDDNDTYPYITEVLARATSITDSIDKLKKGTMLFKIRDKNVRGIKPYMRHYRLDTEKLSIVYFPNKNMTARNCTAGGAAMAAGIDLDDISEVRLGHGTDTFNKLVKDTKSENKNAQPSLKNVSCEKDLCFSVVFKDDTPPLDLVANDKSTRDIWVEVLSHLVATIRSLGEQKEYELFLRKKFKNADKDESGKLTLDECKKLVEELNIKMSKEDLESHFQAASFIGDRDAKTMNEGEFIAFYYSLFTKKELNEVFIKYATDNNRMGVDDLMNFFQTEQKMELIREECEKLIKAFEPETERTSMSLEGFTHFMMFSEWQDIVDPSKAKLVYQDMDQPLSHYWLASSHNT